MSIIPTDEEVTETATTALVLRPEPASIVRQTVATDEVVAAQNAYHDLCARLLDESDYQTIGRKNFPKKSAWRKLAVAFNVSTEIVSKDYERDDSGRIVRAEILVRATAPNGRTEEGLGACDVFEKCCPTAYGESCTNNGKYHRHCALNCSGRAHFSNPSHDLPATAHTRAKNRACADLFGMGEVSAEEITDAARRQYEYDDHGPSQASKPAPPADLPERIKALPESVRAGFPAWLDDNGIPRAPKDWSADNARAVWAWVQNRQREQAGAVQDATNAEVAPEAPPAPESAPSVPSDEQVSEAAGEDAVEAEIARVKGMKPAEVKAELDARGLPTDGNTDTLRKNLVLAVLREQVAAKENA